MFKHIEGNVYSIPIPLPNNPLRELNSYVIKDPERSLVIDTGFNLPECRAALTAGLEELGIDMDRADVFLTHLHSDHSGLAGAIAGRDSRIYISRTDGELLRRSFTDGFDRVNEYRADGFSEAELAKIDENPARRYLQDTLPVFTFVSGGDRIEYGGRKLRVISTPGHTPGHCALWEPRTRTAFLGDAVLFLCSTCIGFWSEGEDAIGTQLSTLRRLAEMDVEHAFLGHGLQEGGVAERCLANVAHHERRSARALAAIRETPGGTGYELVPAMGWRAPFDHWAETPALTRWFLVSESIAHLDHLVATGAVRREPDAAGAHRYFAAEQ